MYRLSIFFDASFDEAEELAERLADQLHEHTREGTEPAMRSLSKAVDQSACAPTGAVVKALEAALFHPESPCPFGVAGVAMVNVLPVRVAAHSHSPSSLGPNSIS